MNWLNLNIQTLDSENFLGSDPIDRATWLCLLRYCIGQENSGVIAGCKTWADRKWQQLVRVTKKESDRHCDLWEWDGNNLIVWGYPDEKEYEVQQLRGIGRQTSEAKRAAAKANGAKGGRPKITQDENPMKTHEEPKTTQRKPIERKGKEVEIEGKENGKEVTPPDDWESPQEKSTKPLCTLDQAKAYAPNCKMTPAQAEHWWHTRNSAGWTKGSTGGGNPRKITSWQSDMATSVSWVGESADKAKQAASATNGSVVIGGRTFKS